MESVVKTWAKYTEVEKIKKGRERYARDLFIGNWSHNKAIQPIRHQTC